MIHKDAEPRRSSPTNAPQAYLVPATISIGNAGK
jgi:hypothetical protein